MRERADQRLGIENLRARDARLGERAERPAVRHGVVADPVALRVRLLGKAPAHGIGELRAEDEEGRRDLRPLQDFQDLLGDAGLGPVVESVTSGVQPAAPWHES